MQPSKIEALSFVQIPIGSETSLCPGLSGCRLVGRSACLNIIKRRRVSFSCTFPITCLFQKASLKWFQNGNQEVILHNKGRRSSKRCITLREIFTMSSITSYLYNWTFILMFNYFSLLISIIQNKSIAATMLLLPQH